MILTFIQVICALLTCHVFAGLLKTLAAVCGCGAGLEAKWFNLVLSS